MARPSPYAFVCIHVWKEGCPRFSFAFISDSSIIPNRLFDQQKLADVYKMSLLLGLISLFAPFNGLVGLCFLIPLAENVNTLKNGLLDIFCNLKALVVSLILFVECWDSVDDIYKNLTGVSSFYSYVGWKDSISRSTFFRHSIQL